MWRREPASFPPRTISDCEDGRHIVLMSESWTCPSATLRPAASRFIALTLGLRYGISTLSASTSNSLSFFRLLDFQHITHLSHALHGAAVSRIYLLPSVLLEASWQGQCRNEGEFPCSTPPNETSEPKLLKWRRTQADHSCTDSRKTPGTLSSERISLDVMTPRDLSGMP